MKVKALIILIILLLVSLSACGIKAGSEPAPVPDIAKLNAQIADLQTQLDKANLNSTKVKELNDKLAMLQADLDKGKALDETSWIYPAKVEYGNYAVNIVMVYIIKVHNGSDEAKDFSIITEPYHNNPDISVAKTPKNIADWITYNEYNTLVFKMQSKETKEITMQFSMPLEGRFYSITDKGLDYTNSLDQLNKLKASGQTEGMSELQTKLSRLDQIYSMNKAQLDTLINFGSNITITRDQVTSQNWDIKRLLDLGLIVDDKTYEFISSYGEADPQGNITARNAVRWIIKMSEYSK
jgi:hypothetical protein